MPTIKLTTLAFYRGETPREITLRDASFPMANAPGKSFAALFGTQGKMAGLAGASAYAASRGVRYTVVDLLVDVERQNPQIMKTADLAGFDFLNFSRASRALRNELQGSLSDLQAVRRLGVEIIAGLATRPVGDALQRWPYLVDVLVEQGGWGHLKAIAFQALTAVGTRPVTIAAVPHRHWSAIREATCRLNPKIHVDLKAPE